jgi:hypothetical protein
MLAFEDRVLREVDRVIYVSNWAAQSVEQARGLRTKSQRRHLERRRTISGPSLRR